MFFAEVVVTQTACVLCVHKPGKDINATVDAAFDTLALGTCSRDESLEQVVLRMSSAFSF